VYVFSKFVARYLKLRLIYHLQHDAFVPDLRTAGLLITIKYKYSRAYGDKNASILYSECKMNYFFSAAAVLYANSSILFCC